MFASPHASDACASRHRPIPALASQPGAPSLRPSLPATLEIDALSFGIGRLMTALSEGEQRTLSVALSGQTPKTLLSAGVEANGLLTYVIGASDYFATHHLPRTLWPDRLLVTCRVDPAEHLHTVLISDLNDTVYCTARFEPASPTLAPGLRPHPRQSARPTSLPPALGEAPRGQPLPLPYGLSDTALGSVPGEPSACPPPRGQPPLDSGASPAVPSPGRRSSASGHAACGPLSQGFLPSSAAGRGTPLPAPAAPPLSPTLRTLLTHADGTVKTKLQARDALGEAKITMDNAKLGAALRQLRGVDKRTSFTQVETGRLRSLLADRDGTVYKKREARTKLSEAKITMGDKKLDQMLRELRGVDKREPFTKATDPEVLPLLKHPDGTAKTLKQALATLSARKLSVDRSRLLKLLQDVRADVRNLPLPTAPLGVMLPLLRAPDGTVRPLQSAIAAIEAQHYRADPARLAPLLQALEREQTSPPRRVLAPLRPRLDPPDETA